jgi:hypothetical protein
LQVRGRRANELEFDALNEVWRSFVDAWIKTQQAIVEFMKFPDLNQLSNSDLETFLETAELSQAQRKQVVGATDKNGGIGSAPPKMRCSGLPKFGVGLSTFCLY